MVCLRCLIFEDVVLTWTLYEERETLVLGMRYWVKGRDREAVTYFQTTFRD